MNVWQTEPALVVAVVVAVLDLLIAFGVPVSADQKVTIVALVTAVLTLVGGWVVRSQVSPVNRHP
jgi:uncharacterized membrane protein